VNKALGKLVRPETGKKVMDALKGEQKWEYFCSVDAIPLPCCIM
jgi:hypothetical protein